MSFSKILQQQNRILLHRFAHFTLQCQNSFASGENQYQKGCTQMNCQRNVFVAFKKNKFKSQQVNHKKEIKFEFNKLSHLV